MADRQEEPATERDTREPVDVIGDELCRTSFGDFKEATFRRIAARLVGRLHATGFRIEREARVPAPQLATMQDKVREFHKALGETPAVREGQLRYDLISEEAEEFYAAVVGNDLEGAADALGDLLYVVFGAAVTFGIDLGPIFDEIQALAIGSNRPLGPHQQRREARRCRA